jgi:hypothetical protein
MASDKVFRRHLLSQSTAATIAGASSSLAQQSNRQDSQITPGDIHIAIETLADLKAMTGRPSAVLVKGKSTTADGWGGIFLWAADDATSPDDALVIQCASDAVGRYKRLYNGPVHARWFGVVADGVVDDSASLQAAVNAAIGGELLIQAGMVLINSSISVVGRIHIRGLPGFSRIMLGTPNLTGLVIGDGTPSTRAACFYTRIEGLTFIPKPFMPPSTSGSVIFRHNVSYVDILDCIFYGHDGTATKLWDGIHDYQVQESNTTRCRFTFLRNNGYRTEGARPPGFETADLRIDFCLFTDLGGAAIYFGQYCQGITVNFPIIYGCSSHGVHVAAIAATGGANFLINQPDIENDGSGVAIYAEDANVVQVMGGWIGGNIAFQTGSNGGSHFLSGVEIDLGQIIISAPACTINGCSIGGDSLGAATHRDGITVNSTGSDFIISSSRVRQFTRYGINLVNQPHRVMISGVSFRTIGEAEINMPNYSLLTFPPSAAACTTDVSAILSCAATLPVRLGHQFVQIHGTIPIAALPALPHGIQVTLQSGPGGFTLVNGPTLSLKGGVNVSVPQHGTIVLITDGSGTWVEVGRNF